MMHPEVMSTTRHYISYYRVLTDKQGHCSILGLEAQITAVQRDLAHRSALDSLWSRKEDAILMRKQRPYALG